jgi:3-hydroxyacyl-CoA dehydrogenase/enoyl-CoA hydratase/3-hydroxybutyryl-CoA epimerase
MKGGKYNMIFLFLSIIILGPFRFMDTCGISKIIDLMNDYQLEYGDRFAPTQLLIDMAKEKKTFYS